MTGLRPTIALAVTTWLSASGCGAGAPLLHGAHALPEGTVTLGGGASGTFARGGLSGDLDAARATTVPGTPSSQARNTTYARGALAAAAAPSGVAPWVGARVGMKYDFDAGITYTGRTARI